MHSDHRGNAGMHRLRKTSAMTRDELTNIVRKSRSTTLLAVRMRQALGLPAIIAAVKNGCTRDRSAKSRRYRNAKNLMRQKHGVRL